MTTETATLPTTPPHLRIKKTILGRKLGMTQIFNEQGELIPVTAVEAGPCRVLQVKTMAKDGYNALQIGFGAAKAKNRYRAERGHLVPRTGTVGEARKEQLKQSLASQKTVPALVKEIPWDGQGEPKVGDEITAATFEGLQKVDVTGIMKGRGFAGVVKRYGFAGGPHTHGQSDRGRAPGSLGRQHSISQGVPPGKRMAGHYGASQFTVKNLRLAGVKKEQNVLLINGAVPGPTGGFVVVREAIVRPKKEGFVKKKEKAPAAKAAKK